MRPFEWTMLGLLAVWVVWPLVVGRRRPWAYLVVVALVAVSAAHVIVEGHRWQMAPIYLMVVVLVLLGVWEAASPAEVPSPSSRRSHGYIVLGLAGVASLAVLPAATPVFEVPEPSGTFGVGTVSFALVDEGRSETYGSDRRKMRELMVQVWYPAESVANVDPVPLAPDLDQVGPALARRFSLPSFFFDHAGLISSNAIADAPPAAVTGEMPVVLYSHGWGGTRAIALPQLEELASHGFAVIAVDHTYAAAATVFPDGRTVEVDPAAFPEVEDVETREEWLARAMALHDVYSADLRFVVAEMRRLDGDEEWVLGSALDLDRLGMLGHSYGGGAVVTACAATPECSAVAALDPYVVPMEDSTIDSGMDQPWLILRSEAWAGDGDRANEDRLASLVASSTGAGSFGVVDGAGHLDFTIAPLFSPIRRFFGMGGSIDATMMIAETNRYLVEFFDGHLASDAPAGSFTGFSDSPVVTIERIEP